MTQSIPRWWLLMQRGFFGQDSPLATNRSASAASSAVAPLLRGLLVLGCVMAIGAASWLGNPVAYLQDDPALARLLRGMAVIKGMIALAVLAAVFWRLAWPVSRTKGAAYLVCSWAIAAATMFIWQLTYIVPAALLFHGAALCLLMVGWRER